MSAPTAVSDGDVLLDQAAAARILNLSGRTMERWRAQRIGPAYLRLSARAIRYRLADLKAFSDGRRIECGGR